MGGQRGDREFSALEWRFAALWGKHGYGVDVGGKSVGLLVFKERRIVTIIDEDFEHFNYQQLLFLK